MDTEYEEKISNGINDQHGAQMYILPSQIKTEVDTDDEVSYKTDNEHFSPEYDPSVHQAGLPFSESHVFTDINPQSLSSGPQSQSESPTHQGQPSSPESHTDNPTFYIPHPPHGSIDPTVYNHCELKSEYDDREMDIDTCAENTSCNEKELQQTYLYDGVKDHIDQCNRPVITECDNTDNENSLSQKNNCTDEKELSESDTDGFVSNQSMQLFCSDCKQPISWLERHMKRLTCGMVYQCNKCTKDTSLGPLGSHHGDDENEQLSDKGAQMNNSVEAAIIESVQSKISQGLDLIPPPQQTMDLIPPQQAKVGMVYRASSKLPKDQDDSKRRYQCTICQLKFKRNAHLHRHLLTHSNEGPFYRCDQCDKSYRDEYNLTRHKKVHEFPETEGVGNLSFPKPYVCGICEMRFRDNHDLQRHLRVHTGEMPYECSICDRRFIDKRSLKNHVIQHNGDKLFVCTICGKKFFEQRLLSRHLKTYKNALHYRCEICERTFHEEKNFIAHATTHQDGQVEIFEFLCTICDKRFKHKKSLKNHQKVHSDNYGGHTSQKL